MGDKVPTPGRARRHPRGVKVSRPPAPTAPWRRGRRGACPQDVAS